MKNWRRLRKNFATRKINVHVMDIAPIWKDYFQCKIGAVCIGLSMKLRQSKDGLLPVYIGALSFFGKRVNKAVHSVPVKVQRSPRKYHREFPLFPLSVPGNPQ